jgi:hypothetical protein
MPLIGRRRPLLRAAAVGGGAYMAGKSRARSQGREADQDARIAGVEQQQYAAPPPQQYAPPAAPAPAPAGMAPGVMDQLKQLGALHEQGILTDEEFATQKMKLLA